MEFSQIQKQLRNLPMAPTELALKQAYLQRPDIHNRVLSTEELQEYYFWMATNFEAPAVYQDTILMDGIIGQLGRHLIRNPKDLDTLAHLAMLVGTSSESTSFAEDQDITISRPLRYLPPHWRTGDYFEVYYVFSGHFPVVFENETLMLDPGDVIILPSSARFSTIYTADDAVFFTVKLRASTFRQVFLDQLAPSNLMTMFFSKALSDGDKDNYLLFKTGLDPALEQVLLAIQQASLESGPYSARIRNPLMSAFFLTLLKRYEHIAQISPRSSMGWKQEFVGILIYIQTHYRTVNMEELSQRFSYSQRQLIRIIRSVTGKTFSALLTQLRMERAAALLNQNILPIEQIAQEVGYSSLSGFYHTFAGYYGTPPGKWQQRHSG